MKKVTQGKVLLIHTWGIGDLILLTPVLQAVKTLYPLLELEILFFPKSAAIPVTDAPFISKIHFTGWKANLLLPTLFKLRKEKYQAVLFSSGVRPWKTWLFMLLLKAEIKVGEYKKFRYPGLSVYVKFNPLLSRTRSNYTLFQSFLNLPSWEEAIVRQNELNLYPYFHLTEANHQWAENFLAENNLTGKKIIGIHPGCMAKNKRRRWNKEYFIALIEKLKRQYDYPILIIAGPDEIEVGKAIQARTKTLLLQNALLENVAAVISRLHFFINTDSGLGHIASCFGIKELTIFGPANELQTAPFSNNSRIIRYPVDCSPCIDKKKKPKCTLDCLLKLTPDMVFKRVQELLD